MIFDGCKGAKIGKTYIRRQHPRFSPLFCYLRDSKSVSLFITNKKNREKTQKIPYFLHKYFAVSDKISNFAADKTNKGYLKQE